jgi:hypothetical protein
VGTGAGVTAYVLDTGIEHGHSEFGGRATSRFHAMGDDTPGAGTLGGKTYVRCRGRGKPGQRLRPGLRRQGTYSTNS